MRGDKNMGVFETIFRKPKADLKAEGYFKMLNGYTPVFSNAPESIYEMELTRAAIHSFASFASKLKPEISGTAQKNLERTLQFKPNPFMDTSKFIYRIATILSVNNTCFIVPIEDEFGVVLTASSGGMEYSLEIVPVRNETCSAPAVQRKLRQ